MKSIRALALVVAACSLPACTGMTGSTGPAPAGPPALIEATGTISGEGSGPQVLVNGIPLNALVRYQGKVTYHVNPLSRPPVTLEGDYTIIVEPLPGREAEAQQAVDSGDLLILRDGKASGLNAPGSIRAFLQMRASLERFYAAPARQNPPLPTPPEPTPLPKPIGVTVAHTSTCCDPNDPTSPCCLPVPESR